MARGEECWDGDARNARRHAEYEQPSEEIYPTIPSSEKASLLQYSGEDKEVQRRDSPLFIKTYKTRFWIVFSTSALHSYAGFILCNGVRGVPSVKA